MAKVATPVTALTEVVPPSVAPLGLVSATVTEAVELVTVFPRPSCTTTCTAGLIAAPAVVLAGCTWKEPSLRCSR